MSKPKYLKPETIRQWIINANRNYQLANALRVTELENQIKSIQERCKHEWQLCQELNGDYTVTTWQRCKICGYEKNKNTKECCHDWHFLPDPSGNNDSEYICDNCGKYSRTRE